MVKAVFLARRYLQDDELDLSFVPEFSDSDNGLTVMNFLVLAHRPTGVGPDGAPVRPAPAEPAADEQQEG